MKDHDLSQMSNFLATDDVPGTLFGIPVVSTGDRYLDKDLEFFKEHPEAGGYYDLGESNDPSGDDPVQADNAGQAFVPDPNTEYDSYKTTEDLLKVLKGGPGRQWAQAPGRETGLKVRNTGGHWYVYPTADVNGNYDAGGYRYFRGHSTGKWMPHTGPGRMTLHQWKTAADEFDRELDSSVGSFITDTLKLDPEKVTGAVRGVLWDIGFVQGPHGLKKLMTDGSPGLTRTFKSLKSRGVDAETAYRMALATEVDTYHKGNASRRMDRFDRLVSKWPEAFTGVREVTGGRTAEDNRKATHELRVKAFKEFVDGYGRKSGRPN